MDKISKLFKKILPIYWAFLTYMLLRPGMANMEFLFTGIDKITHLCIFAMLGFCFMSAYPKTRFIIYIQIMLIYSILTEILQDSMGFGRSLETLDLLADGIGVLAGYFIFIKMKATSIQFNEFGYLNLTGVFILVVFFSGLLIILNALYLKFY